MTVQGNSVSIPTGSDALSAIDTGTTLIGGPSDSVTAIWNAVANSEQLSGEFEGFWAFREYLISSDLTLAPRGSSSSER